MIRTQAKLDRIELALYRAEFTNSFIHLIMDSIKTYDNLFDLCWMWYKEKDVFEQAMIIADIEDLLDSIILDKPVTKPVVLPYGADGVRTSTAEIHETINRLQKALDIAGELTDSVKFDLQQKLADEDE